MGERGELTEERLQFSGLAAIVRRPAQGLQLANRVVVDGCRLLAHGPEPLQHHRRVPGLLRRDRLRMERYEAAARLAADLVRGTDVARLAPGRLGRRREGRRDRWCGRP